MASLLATLGKEVIFLDGAMGTMLQRNGLKLGKHPESMSITHPGAIEAVHRSYVEAGSQILLTNTFGANRKKLSATGHELSKIVSQSVQIAKTASQGFACVALDIGPIGESLVPIGTLGFDECVDIYKDVVIAGTKAGADLIFIETIFDLYEMKAAITACKENSDLPIFASMTFAEDGRTFLGCPPSAAAALLTGLGVTAIGVNCSVGPKTLVPVIKEITQNTPLPVFAKPNAGMPRLDSPNNYDLSPREFAAEMMNLYELGVCAFGGCCGTSPEYISAVKERFTGRKLASRNIKQTSVVCSGSKSVVIDSVRIIGERINPTGKKLLKEALVSRDTGYIQHQALSQLDAGAEILDVNVGMPGIDEAETLEWIIPTIQAVTDAPLQIDTTNPKALERALRIYNGKPIVNSVNGEEKSISTVLPIVKKYGASVVGLTLDERGIPKTAVSRFEVAQKILKSAKEIGISENDVFIDCLTLTVSAEPDGAVVTLDALAMVKEKLELKTVLGVSNISFGLPNREFLNLMFLTMAMERGLTLPIVNPNINGVTDAVVSYRLLKREDKNPDRYIERFGEESSVRLRKDPNKKLDVKTAIIRALPQEAATAAEELLKTEKPLDVINSHIIPALDEVGERFEQGKVYLPQMLQSSEAAKAAFKVLKKHMDAKSGGAGRILIATVKGDIHDIGKNIVKVILENYGFEMIDMGRDVSSEDIVAKMKSENIRLVGLSALMTTTLPSMKATIKALKAESPYCKVFVGGAVLTKEYAEKIGADFYAKDAKTAVDYAKKVFTDL
ncbi:5-methyltetrahydrofolate--homocysteine methyltransferase [Clostridia bacterium]|nr:5-methyltetrahydrofolate--homocysteine methyltransferase [Clostridia bacterium]